VKNFKLVIIGGGSSYTPELADGLIRKWNMGEFLCREIVLVDIPEGKVRMEIVASFVRRMIKKSGMPTIVKTTTNRKESLDGATFVISQFRVGGMKARRLDEHLPIRYDVIGQETTGPGGFANALRTIPCALDIAQDVREYARDAWLLNFTNPSGLITEALLRYTDVNTFGLCNVPICIKMAVANALSVDSSRISMDVSGLNHLSFVTGVYLDGTDITDKLFRSPLIEEYFTEIGLGQSSFPFFKNLKVIPSSYLYYYWCSKRALETVKESVQTGQGTRAEQVMKIEKELFERYKEPSQTSLPPELKKRGGAYYSEVALNSISAIVNNTPAVEALNVKNLGAVFGLSSDVVVEVSSVVDGRGPQPIAQKPLPQELLGLIQKVKTYEKLTVESAVSGDVDKAFFALLNHPLVPDADTALAILRDTLEANEEYLPLFRGKKI